jgi:hypothetical protein
MKKLVLALGLLTALMLGSAAMADDGLLLPIITVQPTSYDFGSVPLNAIATGYLLVTNEGDAPLIVNAVKTKAPFLDGATSFTVPAHSSRRITIGFAPTVLGPAYGYCTIQSNAHNAPVLNVPLSGVGVE